MTAHSNETRENNPDHRTRRVLSRLALAISVASLSGLIYLMLRASDSDRPSADETVKLFGSLNDSVSSRASVVGDSSNIRVVIDESASMQGYVRPAASSYVRVVKGLLDEASSLNGDVTVRRFESDAPVREPVLRQVMYTSFYNGKDTRLSRLLQRIVDDSASTTEWIVVSDLIISDAAADQLSVSRGFAALAAQHRPIEILAFRSRFEGWYYPEVAVGLPKRWISAREADAGHASGDSADQQGRPFYLVLIGRPRSTFGAVENVAANLGSKHRFSAHDMLDRFSLLEIDTSAARQGWRAETTSDTVRGRYRDSAFVSWLRYFPSGHSSRARLHLSAEMLSSASDLLRNPYRLRVIGPQTLAAGPVANLPQSFVDSHLSGNRLSTELTVSLPARERWDAYEIDLVPDATRLRPPQWVMEWSTDDDSRPESDERTLNVWQIVQTILRTSVENFVVSEQYLLVTGN